MKRLATIAMMATLFGALFLPLQSAGAQATAPWIGCDDETVDNLVDNFGYEVIDMTELGITEVHAGSGSQVIIGTADADVIYAGSGNDYVCGGTGDDYIDGGSGADHLIGNWGADTIMGGSGDDYILGGGHFDDLYGGSGDDQIYGSPGSGNTCDGGSGDNFLDEYCNTLS